MIAAIRDKMAEPPSAGGLGITTKWYLDDGFIYYRSQAECTFRMKAVTTFITKLGIS